ncbi:MAG: winged helix-turn-helix domain-containing protein, partial [Arcobacteraceae bacterium]
MYLIDKDSKIPLHIQLYEEIKKEIIYTLKVGDKLQSIRKVATLYNLSKTSVESAYSQLIAEGYIDSYPQKGYFVADSNYENFQGETTITPKNEK